MIRLRRRAVVGGDGEGGTVVDGAALHGEAGVEGRRPAAGRAAETASPEAQRDGVTAPGGRRAASLAAVSALLAGVGFVTAQPRRVEASYYPGAGPGGSDLIDNHLYTTGSLWVMGGYLGIGTSTPPALLTLNWPGNAFIGFQTSGVTVASVGYDASGVPGLNFYELTASSWPRLLIQRNTGNIGIATNSPVQQLDVAGNIQASNALMVNGLVAVDNTGTAKKAYYAP